MKHRMVVATGGGGLFWLMEVLSYVKQNQISSETMTRDDFKRLIHVELRLRNFLGTVHVNHEVRRQESTIVA